MLTTPMTCMIRPAISYRSTAGHSPKIPKQLLTVASHWGRIVRQNLRGYFEQSDPRCPILYEGLGYVASYTRCPTRIRIEQKNVVGTSIIKLTG
ncbi:jg19822 [Pararge aegeria aegeria]|uniref:Jg19822 protein n=1 Tax=Pararge aegeria aegeria TaxID=348720 RepID=A0A8S4SFD8_9NEOP|nr:jg19822 [Pararge aegeria aegeria]